MQSNQAVHSSGLKAEQRPLYDAQAKRDAMDKLKASTEKAKGSLISLRLPEDTSAALLAADINVLQAAIRTLEG